MKLILRWKQWVKFFIVFCILKCTSWKIINTESTSTPKETDLSQKLSKSKISFNNNLKTMSSENISNESEKPTSFQNELLSAIKKGKYEFLVMNNYKVKARK